MKGTRILEPIVDLVISHSILTSWLVDALSSLLGSQVSKSLAHTCSVCNKFMSTFFYAILEENNKFHQYCSCVMSDPCL